MDIDESVYIRDGADVGSSSLRQDNSILGCFLHQNRRSLDVILK
jgi:hypothetical protein